MTLQEYLQKVLKINEGFPFKTPLKCYKKGEKILDIGNVEENIYYLVSGITKACMIVKGEEKIIDFTFPSQFVTSLTSMITKMPSDVYFTCLEDCVIEIIPYQQLKQACVTSLSTNKFYKFFLEHFYVIRVKKEKDLITKNAEQRYEELIKVRPNVLQEISLKEVARYLGVHPNSLSRIRKKIVTQK